MIDQELFVEFVIVLVVSLAMFGLFRLVLADVRKEKAQAKLRMEATDERLGVKFQSDDYSAVLGVLKKSLDVSGLHDWSDEQKVSNQFRNKISAYRSPLPSTSYKSKYGCKVSEKRVTQ